LSLSSEKLVSKFAFKWVNLYRYAEELSQLTALTELSLDRNKLESVPAAFGKLVALENLDLSGNRLTSVPAELGELASLTVMDLRDNRWLRSVPRELTRGAFALEIDDGFIVVDAPPPSEDAGEMQRVDEVKASDGGEKSPASVLPAGADAVSNGYSQQSAAAEKEPEANTSSSSLSNATPPDVRVLLEWRARDPALRHSWQAEDDGEGFFGVEFGEGEDEDRVVGINLTNEGLTGALPACLGGLDKLTHLNLGGAVQVESS
jgi:hypothetical protein